VRQLVVFQSRPVSRLRYTQLGVRVSEWRCREAAGGIPESAREPSPVYPAGRVGTPADPNIPGGGVGFINTVRGSSPELVLCGGGAHLRVTSVTAAADDPRQHQARGRRAVLPLQLQCQILPLPISRYHSFKFQSNLVWDSIKPISNCCFQF
jgi:hypothetical protein